MGVGTGCLTASRNFLAIGWVDWLMDSFTRTSLIPVLMSTSDRSPKQHTEHVEKVTSSVLYTQWCRVCLITSSWHFIVSATKSAGWHAVRNRSVSSMFRSGPKFPQEREENKALLI